MALDLTTVGLETQPHELPYDWKSAALYALGIGATRDELDYLYEGRGPKVYPTMGVVPAFAPVLELLQRTGGDIRQMVHGSQVLRTLAPIPPEGTFRTVGRIDAIYDLKRLAQAVVSTRTEVNGATVCDTEWTLIFLKDGGFGGPRPKRTPGPKAATDEPPAFESRETTSPEQALLYRLSGDTNPLHADPDVARSVGFERGPILHGLATYGYVARALVRHACDGDASRLKQLTCNFKKPVWPGDTLRTVAHRAEAQLVVRTFVGDGSDAVVEGWAEIT